MSNHMHPTDRVRRAILNADFVSGPDAPSYFQKCLEMRAARSGEAMGSTYNLTVDSLRTGILSLEWEEYSHPDISAPAVGFIARCFGGHLGIIETTNLDPYTEIELTDPKGTGFVEGHVTRFIAAARPRVDFTVALLGPASAEPGAPETLWTFHPGPPVKPSRIATLDREGLIVSKARAIELGLEWVKLS